MGNNKTLSASYSVSEHIIHSLKTAFACLFGFIVIKLAHVPFDQWLIVTIIVVMCSQINVGSVFQKAYIRFFGTLAGSSIAAISLLLFPNSPLASATAVAFSAMLFSYIGTSDSPWSDTGTLGAATTAIILLGQKPTITLAGTRTLEILIGIVIAALVSQFLLPIHARSHLKRTQARTVKQLKNYYLTILGQDHEKNSEHKIHLLDEKIVTLLQAQRRLAKDATQETLGLFNAKFFKQLLWCEKELLRVIDFLHQCYKKLSPEGLIFLNSRFDMDVFNKIVIEAFDQIVVLIELKDKTQTHVQQFGKITHVSLQNAEQLKNSDLIHAASFIFFVKLLTRRLREMAFLIKRMQLS